MLTYQQGALRVEWTGRPWIGVDIAVGECRGVQV